MSLYTHIKIAIESLFGFITWRDGIEIAFFTVCVYVFSRWLAQDQQKNLVGYLYSYCFITMTAHLLGISAISSFLLLAAPVIVCVFILIHHKTLQRNFIALTRITPAHISDESWLSELIQTSLYAMNRRKNIVWMIEKSDTLETVLTAPYRFFSDLKKDLLILLLDTDTMTPETIIWINRAGKVVTVNAQCTITQDPLWNSPEIKQLPPWHQQALTLSMQTNALILHCCSSTRLFTLIVQGKTVDELSAHHAFIIIKKLLLENSQYTEDIPHASQSSHTTYQQKHPEN